MPQSQTSGIRKPRTDDRLLWDLILNNIGYSAVLVAYNLKIFPLLAEEPRTLTEVCDALQLAKPPIHTLLSTCVEHGLLQQHASQNSLSPLAEHYLLPTTPPPFHLPLHILTPTSS